RSSSCVGYGTTGWWTNARIDTGRLARAVSRSAYDSPDWMVRLLWPMIASHGLKVSPGTSVHSSPSMTSASRLGVHHQGAVPSEKSPLMSCSTPSSASCAYALPPVSSKEVVRAVAVATANARFRVIKWSPLHEKKSGKWERSQDAIRHVDSEGPRCQWPSCEADPLNRFIFIDWLR